MMNHNHHHHQTNSNSSGNKATTAMAATTELVLRPTEAQLRWAQFHHHRRALAVREKIQRLYQTPESVSDVEGALSDDGRSTSSSNDSNAENNKPLLIKFRREKKASRRNSQKEKPTISRGRRALLRVSKRAYEKRRQEIMAHGFLCAVGEDDDHDDHRVPNHASATGTATAAVGSKRQPGKLKQRLMMRQNSSDDAPEDGVEAIFAEEAAWKKKRKRRHARRFKVSDDEDRVRRFEAAFHAMMMNMSASQQQQHPEPLISPSGKRWTRAVPVAVSIDGRHYDDLKWGVTFRTNSTESPTSATGSHSMTPMDRGATWMIHLPSKPKQQPKRQNITIITDGDGDDRTPLDTPSAGRMKFNSLVAMLQQRTMVKSGPDLMERRVPKMRLRLGKEQEDGGTVHLPPISTNKRWTKPEMRVTREPGSTDGRRHPYQVEFVVDGQHFVMSPHDSDSSGLPSPPRSNQKQQQRWTFTGPSSSNSPESDAVTDLFATLRDADTPKSMMGDSVAESDVYAALRNGTTPKSEVASDIWRDARQVSPTGTQNVQGNEMEANSSPRSRMQQAAAAGNHRIMSSSTPKSITGDSVADSDVYASLRNGNDYDNNEGITPKSIQDGESDVWRDARQVSPNKPRRVDGDAMFQRLQQQAQADNEQSMQGTEYDGITPKSAQDGESDLWRDARHISPQGMRQGSHQAPNARGQPLSGTPKSLTGDSVTDSDVYSALRNANDDDEEGITPRSVQDGESDIWRDARQVSPSGKHQDLGSRLQRLQIAQANNNRSSSSKNTPVRLLIDPDASPSKESLHSMSSSEASPANVKGIWRSARNAAGAALSQLSVSMLNAANENAPQSGSPEKKGSQSSALQVENMSSHESTTSKGKHSVGARNGALNQEGSGRSSQSGESQFWDDIRMAGNQPEQSNSDPVDGGSNGQSPNSSGRWHRPRELDIARHDQSYGVTTPSSDSESSVWRTARNVGDMKSPSSLPSIPERLASGGISETTKENHQYPLNSAEQKGTDFANHHSPEKRHGDPRSEEMDDSNSNVSKGSEVWRLLRNQAKVGSRLLNMIPESKVGGANNNASSPDKAADITSSISQTAVRAVGSIGGVLKMFSGKKESSPEDEAKEEEMKAVAAFRKTQGERQHFDAKSTSTSSFGVLPESIRQVVQQYGSPNVDEDDDDDMVYEADPAQNSYELDEYDDDEEYNSTVLSSPNRPMDKMSPERARDIHQMVMMNSVLIGDKETEHTIIDTDDTTSSASIDGYNPRAIASLMLSPALLTKRLHQAIRAIKKRNWEQVAYLLSANPWLAEMVDVTTNQYLLHKLALYGGGASEIDPLTGEVMNVQHPPAPEQLNNDLLRMFPASVHKFDKDGNLPLHMAAASGNINMIKLLASRFPEGASVRNEEGMLPLHLIILACASPSVARNAKESPKQMVEALLGYFRGAVAVTDNDGNLPIHSAAISLVGESGVDVVYLLMDEADRQASDPYGPRFSAPSSKVHADCDSASVATVETTSPTDSSHNGDDVVRCNAVRNLLGETALMAAINARAGWEMIEAIASGPGGRDAVLLYDANRNTALHLLVSGETADPAAVLSILKIAPQAASRRNDKGMLPIEVACMQSMPREVIVALLLVDLPVDLDDKEGVKIIEGAGGSWWFLTCESDDQYVDVVEEIVGICSYQQMREMCFMKGGHAKNAGPVVSRATPKCREVLLRALRFVGRFEFLGNASVNSDLKPSVKVFDALDFGTDEAPFEDGRRVLLYCFASQASYLEETAIRRGANLHASFVEETFDFVVHEDGTEESPPQQFCVAVESPSQTLNLVVAGMLDNPDYERKPELRKRYMVKVCLVLRQIAKALCHLHAEGVIHADLCLENCGKFGDRWKLASTMGIQNVGKSCDPSRLGESAPPEAVELVKRDSSTRQASFKSNLATHPSMDIWAFGKLAYEALVGEPLLDFDTTLEPKSDSRALNDIMKWNKTNLKEVAEDLAAIGVPNTGIELITNCLMPQPHKRPPTMERVLAHPFWKDIQRLNAASQKSGRENRSNRRSPK